MLANNRSEARASKKGAATRVMSTKAIHAIRLKNLKALIDERYDGNAAEAARAIKRSHTFLWQLINRRRAIGEDTARHVERSLYLDLFALDRDVAGGLRQTTKLRVLERYGEEVKEMEYRLVPEVEITRGLNRKTGRQRPCPITCSEATVYVKTTSDSLYPLLARGDDVFIDKEQTKLIDGAVYGLQVEGKTDPVFMIAEPRDGGGWRYFVLHPGAGDDKAVNDTRVTKVYGRAIYKGQPVQLHTPTR